MSAEDKVRRAAEAEFREAAKDIEELIHESMEDEWTLDDIIDIMKTRLATHCTPRLEALSVEAVTKAMLDANIEHEAIRTARNERFEFGPAKIDFLAKALAAALTARLTPPLRPLDVGAVQNWLYDQLGNYTTVDYDKLTWFVDYAELTRALCAEFGGAGNMETRAPDECRWTWEERSGRWHTSCGVAPCGGSPPLDFDWCCYCGAKIVTEADDE